MVEQMSNVARGWAMGHLHPPTQNCYALDRMQFLDLIYKKFNINSIFSQKCPIAPPPPRQISDYATVKKISQNFIHFLVEKNSVNFINMFTGSFYTCRSQKHKKLLDLTEIFVVLGSASVKAARKMLVKLTPDRSVIFLSTQKAFKKTIRSSNSVLHPNFTDFTVCKNFLHLFLNISEILN